jgi:uncharacterized membrane protein YdbT with pleckstrin-like domain
MAFPDALLSRGERVVVHKHPHWKVLVVPLLLLLVIVAATAFMMVWIGHWDDSGLTTHRWWYVAVVIVAVVLLVIGTVVPFLRWQTEHFVLTTSHVFFRTGILHRRQHQIPLVRVQNIETVVTFWGRIFGFGTLIVDSAADEPLEFSNVASLTKIQGTLNQLIADDRGRSPDPDTGDTAVVPRP